MRLTTFALCFLLGACGDDGSSSPDGAPAPDGGPDAGSAEGCVCMALGADYEAGVGVVSRVSLPDLTVTTDVAPGAISSDPVARLFGWTLVVVNRFGADNVTIIDGVTEQVTDQFSTGAGTNPQDAALVDDDRLYVVALNSPSVLIYDLADTSAPAATIDVSSYDPDGIPNATSIHVVGDRAYVVLGLLDDATFVPRGNGLVVVIDLATDTIETTFELNHTNPTGFLRAVTDRLAIVTAADYSGTMGCLEMIDPTADETQACHVMNADLAGIVNAFAAVEDDVYAAVVEAVAGEGRLWHVAANGTPDGAPLTPSAQDVTDVAYCAATNQLLYNDGATGGLRVWDLGAGQEATTAPLDIGLPAAFGNGIVCW